MLRGYAVLTALALTAVLNPAGQAQSQSYEEQARAAADALMAEYNPDTALWDGTGWWNAANVTTSLLDLDDTTGDHAHLETISQVYETNLDESYGQFRNHYLDDTGWWGLAWIRAYDLTGDQRYLDTARLDAEHMRSHWDDTCGGGVWWSEDHSYKNAITNELFIKLTAALHNRIPGDTTYRDWSRSAWEWFDASGMINDDDLVNDGLGENCVNDGSSPTYTYNQGVILGGLVELSSATGDATLFDRARQIADAATTSPVLNTSDGVLREPDEQGSDGGGDAPSFKGAFIRNLGQLDDALADGSYADYLDTQAESLINNDRNERNQYGYHWYGPFDKSDPARQHSALDGLVAATEP